MTWSAASLFALPGAWAIGKSALLLSGATALAPLSADVSDERAHIDSSSVTTVAQCEHREMLTHSLGFRESTRHRLERGQQRLR